MNKLIDEICENKILQIRKLIDEHGDYHQTDVEKIYILGPMTKIKDMNLKAFFEAEKKLTKEGFVVLNPGRNPLGLNPIEYMQIDIQMVFFADAVYRLKGWENSSGAKIENAIAEFLGLEIYEEEE